jgi:hypothetical protein
MLFAHCLLVGCESLLAVEKERGEKTAVFPPHQPYMRTPLTPSHQYLIFALYTTVL